MRTEAFPLAQELFRKPNIVGVQKREIVSKRFFHSAIACPRQPTILLPHIANAITICGETLGRVICGTIVDDNNLHAPVCLRESTLDGLDRPDAQRLVLSFDPVPGGALLEAS